MARPLRSRPDILGRALVLDEQPYVVVGVLPRQLVTGSARASGSFEFLKDEEHYWVPFQAFSPPCEPTCLASWGGCAPG